MLFGKQHAHSLHSWAQLSAVPSPTSLSAGSCVYLRPVHHSEHRLPVSYTGASRAGLVSTGPLTGLGLFLLFWRLQHA